MHFFKAVSSNAELYRKHCVVLIVWESKHGENQAKSKRLFVGFSHSFPFFFSPNLCISTPPPLSPPQKASTSHTWPPTNPFPLLLSSSSWFIMPVIQRTHHRAAESSMPFAGHQWCLCLWDTLLPAGLWMLVAISTLKFYCCGEMKAISYHTPRGVQKWIFSLLYSQPGSSPFLKTAELQSRGNIRCNLSLCPGHAVSGYRQWCWFHSMSDFTRLLSNFIKTAVTSVCLLNTTDVW